MRPLSCRSSIRPLEGGGRIRTSPGRGCRPRRPSARDAHPASALALTSCCSASRWWPSRCSIIGHEGEAEPRSPCPFSRKSSQGDARRCPLARPVMGQGQGELDAGRGRQSQPRGSGPAGRFARRRRPSRGRARRSGPVCQTAPGSRPFSWESSRRPKKSRVAATIASDQEEAGVVDGGESILGRTAGEPAGEIPVGLFRADRASGRSPPVAAARSYRAVRPSRADRGGIPRRAVCTAAMAASASSRCQPKIRPRAASQRRSGVTASAGASQTVVLPFQFEAASREPSRLQATTGLNPPSVDRDRAPRRIRISRPSSTSRIWTFDRLTPASRRPSGLNARRKGCVIPAGLVQDRAGPRVPDPDASRLHPGGERLPSGLKAIG